MLRLSFRKGMLIGFVVIVFLLGGAALQSWRVVAQLVEQHRQGSEDAILLTASIQELAERTIDIERSARQYLVLDDPAFRQRFDNHLTQSLELVEHLEQKDIASMKALLHGWRMVAEAVRSGLETKIGGDALSPMLERLVELNSLLKTSGQQWIDLQNTHLQQKLDASGRLLTIQTMLALAGAILVALAMGWWLIRPMRQLEQAISHLGASRYDQRIEVNGPADLRHLGLRLDWLRHRLAELEADRERSLRHVSHELKTPLTALREGVALLQDEVPGPLDPSQREVVTILQSNVLNLQKQIESLLSLNAATLEARRIHLLTVDLRKLLENVVHGRDFHLKSRKLNVKIEVPEVSSALLDQEKMSIVLDNLLSNAIDFSPEQGEILLRVRRGEKELSFECIDQGPGIAEDELQRVFEPFVQGQRPAPVVRQGSGVGLSIVRELTLGMGGEVAAYPAEQGAHICVVLPNEK